MLVFVGFGIASRKAPDTLSGNRPGNTVKAPDPVAAEAPTEPETEQPTVDAQLKARPRDEPLPMVTGEFATEPDYDDAELMLREVKAMLLQGRPDRAIAFIRSVAGVDEDLATEFVEEIQQGLYG